MGSELLKDICISPNLVCMSLEASSDQEALDLFAKQLHEAGMVKESYIEAVKNREKQFSTGLGFEDMGIAIPHTDIEHVNQTAIGIAVLKEPVEFAFMGMPDVPVKVEMMFMMAMKESHSQVEFLQLLMEMFQTKGRLQSLKASQSAEEMVEKFQSFFP